MNEGVWKRLIEGQVAQRVPTSHYEGKYWTVWRLLQGLANAATKQRARTCRSSQESMRSARDRVNRDAHFLWDAYGMPFAAIPLPRVDQYWLYRRNDMWMLKSANADVRNRSWISRLRVCC